MTRRSLVAVAALATVALGVVSNPPPGRLLGIELPLAAWAGLAAVSVLGALVAIAWPRENRAWVAAGVVPLLLVGPLRAFGSLGFLAQVAGGVSFALLLEALSSVRRLDAWRGRLREEAALASYRSAYARAYAKLAIVLSAGVASAMGVLWMARAWGPSAFALSLEAKRPEGLVGLLVVLGAVAAGAALVAWGSEGLARTDEASARGGDAS